MEASSAAQTRFARLELSFGHFDALEAVRFVRRFPPHFHETFAIGVVEEGSCVIRTRRGSWTAAAGSILAFAPGEMHAASPCAESGYAYRMVYPSITAMHEIGVRWRGAPLFSAPVIRDASLAESLRRAQRPLLDGTGGHAAEAGLADALRHLGLRHVSRETPGQLRATDLEVVTRAHDYMATRLSHPLRLPEVARACDVSMFQLIRVFRRVAGVTPMAYLVQLRVTRARRLLTEGMNAGTAAHLCGFSDQSHLTRVFREIVGVPPGRYSRFLEGAVPRPATSFERR
jgi:AraC-like DNA-binding protein